MPCTRLRDLLQSGRTALGCWTSLADAAAIEVVANAGFDYVSIDLEHSPLDLQTLIGLLRTADACGISSMVRVPAGDEALLQRVADMGPDGLYFPHIRDAADARRAVERVRYPPLGQRGVSLNARVGRYGNVDDQLAHRREVNAHLIVYLQIEEASAVAEIDDIVAIEGVDVCGLAPHDLAQSLGCRPSLDDARFRECAETVARAVTRNGKVWLAAPATGFGLEGALGLGAKMVTVSDATAAMHAALRERQAAARKLLDSR